MMALSKSALFSGLLAFILITFFASTPLVKHAKVIILGPYQKESNLITAPKKNVWADLTEEEAVGVKEYVFRKNGLNLTEASKASPLDKTLRLIEVLKPNKTAVLSYLEGKTGEPEKWARVVINDGSGEDALIVNYMVGPLPINEATIIQPLTFCFNSDRNHVIDPVPNYDLLAQAAVINTKNFTDVFQELLGGKIDYNDPDTLGAVFRSVRFENGTLSGWAQIYRNSIYSGAVTLMPQGLYLRFDVDTRGEMHWTTSSWYYNGALYPSVDDLRRAMKSSNFQKVPQNIEGDWVNTEEFGNGHPGRNKPPPVMIQPEGSRYLYDKKERFVSYMGFEFYLTTASDTGIALHDIRFHGDSVMYEVGLQEAMAHYAGDDPQQGGLEFLDTTFMMGRQMYELVPGYDCPTYATYLPSVFSLGDTTITNKNSICIFEYTSDHVLQRHTTPQHVSISRNTYLVVRSVSTLGNYDYTIDYIFYLDGTIEVKVRASGYIFAAFWSDTKEDEYGYRIHDAIASSMHDHVINFKADLDILGTSNSVMRVGIEPLTKQFPWDDDLTGPRNTMHLVERPVETETGLNWPGNGKEMLIVMNEKERNAWGERRGYRVAAGTGMGNPTHLTILNSTTLGASAEWANNDLWILKRKDTEPMSSSALNSFEPRNPLVNFMKFVDGERVREEDLVVYFNLGSHHIPHSGDIPNTLMHTSASSVMFTPFNFNDRDPSRRSSQGVRVDRTDGSSNPRYFGRTYENGVTLKTKELEPDLTSLHTLRQVLGNGTWIPGWIGRS